MPQSLSAVYVHGVFSAKDRNPFLLDAEFRRDVHAYMAGITKHLDCPAVEIGGVDDHVHLLVRLSRTITIADWMRETKRVSSAFIKESNKEFSWQAGYGAFSVSIDALDSVMQYILNQEEHH